MGFVQCGHFTDKEGSSDADVRIFWCKNFGFFEIYGVSERTRGIELVRTLFEQGGGQFFAILCGRPLWAAPKVFQYSARTELVLL